MPRSLRWRADLLLAFIALVWGATFVIVKQALDSVSTLLFLALRFSLAALAMALAFRIRLGSLRLGRSELKAGVLTGLFLFAGYALQTFGLRFTTPSKSAFVTGLYVPLVPFAGSLVYRKAPHAAEVLGIVLATLGMGLMTIEPGTLAIGGGDLLTLGCAIAFAFHILMVGRYSRRTGVEMFSLVQIATVAAIAAAAFGWAEPLRIQWNGAVLLAVTVTALLATALAFTAQVWAQQHTTPTRTALIFSLEPVFAGLTSAVVVGEILSARAMAGAALIMAGILLVELKPAGREKHPLEQVDLNRAHRSDSV